ncbi:hypothetical protein BT96DRAFT_950296 [Gymnopus androsaceus JB14]|uniref:CxC2-like cysteine cluster KDZ transposase-associated domain-containing protein n=1 Tax=Gymnopus androsaceus JB14 TaxID=1447944 RepID=A0A6A4GGX3_9AGAR|nr:hypothetical protein BT96DRAFT_950296 [Gymnopus androsaceus JB14]
MPPRSAFCIFPSAFGGLILFSSSQNIQPTLAPEVTGPNLHHGERNVDMDAFMQSLLAEQANQLDEQSRRLSVLATQLSYDLNCRCPQQGNVGQCKCKHCKDDHVYTGPLLSKCESIAWAFMPGKATDRQILRVLRAGHRPDVQEYVCLHRPDLRERHEQLMAIHASVSTAIRLYTLEIMPSMSSIELALAHQLASPRPQNSSPLRVGNLNIVGREERIWIVKVHGEDNLEWMLESRDAQRRLLQDQLAPIKDALLQELRAQYVQAHPLGITAKVADKLEKKAYENAYEMLRGQKRRELEEWSRERAQERRIKLAGGVGEDKSATSVDDELSLQILHVHPKELETQHDARDREIYLAWKNILRRFKPAHSPTYYRIVSKNMPSSIIQNVQQLPTRIVFGIEDWECSEQFWTLYTINKACEYLRRAQAKGARLRLHGVRVTPYPPFYNLVYLPIYYPRALESRVQRHL